MLMTRTALACWLYDNWVYCNDACTKLCTYSRIKRDSCWKCSSGWHAICLCYSYNSIGQHFNWQRASRGLSAIAELLLNLTAVFCFSSTSSEVSRSCVWCVNDALPAVVQGADKIHSPEDSQLLQQAKIFDRCRWSVYNAVYRCELWQSTWWSHWRARYAIVSMCGGRVGENR